MSFGNSLFFILILLIISCDKQNEQPNDFEYILFGHFYGFCMGEQCIEIYKLTDSELFEDQKGQYPSREVFYEGDYQKLDHEKFELVKSL